MPGSIWVQLLAGLYVRAFLEQALLDHAADLRAHLRDLERLRTAGQQGRDPYRLGLERHDPDRLRRQLGAAACRWQAARDSISAAGATIRE
ncbi:hypothetical protein RAA17_06130 [Komagataeibacter rhaeticus]|nr:hypothetical protein [Komagataeibacter rhaeticus]